MVWLEKPPRVILGMGLLLPLICLDYDGGLYRRLYLPYDIVPFLLLLIVISLGALRRRSVWNCLIAVIAGAVVFPASDYLETPYLRTNVMLTVVLFPFLVILTTGIAEACFNENRSSRFGIFVILNCLASASIYCVLQRLIEYSALPVGLVWTDQLQEFLIFRVLRWSFLAISLWGAISLSESWALANRKWMVFVSVATATIALACCYFYFSVGIFCLAERSLKGNGPFPRIQAVNLLHVRGSKRDYDLLLQELSREPIPSWTAYYANETLWRTRSLQALEKHFGDELNQVLERRFPQGKEYFLMREGKGNKD